MAKVKLEMRKIKIAPSAGIVYDATLCISKSEPYLGLCSGAIEINLSKAELEIIVKLGSQFLEEHKT